MAILPQVLMNGLFASSVYCLVALGLTLILGVMDIADFAQGAIYMLGAYVAFLVFKVAGLAFPLALALAVLAPSLVGILNNVLVYQPVLRRGANSLIAALGVLLIIQNAALLVFGPDYQTYQLPFGRSHLTLLQGTIPLYKVTIILSTAALVGAVWLFLFRTRMGKAIRALSQDREGAAILGIGAGKVSILTFAIGSALVSLAGGLVSPIYAFDVSFGSDVIVKAFTVVIFGGLGSISGAVIGALLIGIGENLIAGYLSTEYSTLATFTLLLLILFLRPQGILGKRAV